LAQPNDQITAGVAAMDRGHYSIAMRSFRVDADQGNAMAQNNIGYLYEQGLGVGQSYPEAMAWYRKAADHEIPLAQYALGLMYANGHGVPKHDVEAYGWLLLAGARGNESARKDIPNHEKELTRAQRAEGQRWAREFVRKSL
jgi:TPR repeat protein